MKMHATSKNDSSRKSAEWTGLRATMTAMADASARTEKITKSQPAVPVSSAPPVTRSAPLHDGERLHVLGLAPVDELADVQVERLVAVVRRHLVGLRRQPDRLRHRRAGLLAELAEHAAL